jgi:hypothetical protein
MAYLLLCEGVIEVKCLVSCGIFLHCKIKSKSFVDKNRVNLNSANQIAQRPLQSTYSPNQIFNHNNSNGNVSLTKSLFSRKNRIPMSNAEVYGFLNQIKDKLEVEVKELDATLTEDEKRAEEVISLKENLIMSEMVIQIAS